MSRGYVICIMPYVRYSVYVPEGVNAEEYLRRWAKRTEVPKGVCRRTSFVKVIMSVANCEQLCQIKEFAEFPLEYIKFKNCEITNYGLEFVVTVRSTGEVYEY